jgi:DNA polymerase V
VNRDLLVRRLNIVANHVLPEAEAPRPVQENTQLDFFIDYEAEARQNLEEQELLTRERRMQQAMLSIRDKFGKNAILRGMNLEEGATTRSRNNQIGGHQA